MTSFDMSTDQQLIFVYGSLKAGQSNHHWLAGATALGRRHLIGARLHDLGPYPMVVLEPGGEGVVHGELYAVDPAGLARLDVLEGYPEYYGRSLCALSDGTMAWVYHGQSHQVHGAAVISHGDWGSTPVLHYGSNLNPSRLQERCPDWDGHGKKVQLEGWSWAIDKLSQWGTPYGYAGIRPSRGSITWGVITHLSASDVASLDGCEGVNGGHYRREMVLVRSLCGAVFQALTYVPGIRFRRDGLLASPTYSRHILAGLNHWDFPAAWRSRLAASLSTTT